MFAALIALLAAPTATIAARPAASVARTGVSHLGSYRAVSAVRMQLDDATVKAKLKAMRKKGKQRNVARSVQSPVTAQPGGAASSTTAPLASLPGDEAIDVAVWEVPEPLRMPGAPRCPQDAHGRHYSLEELFPGTGLAEAWDTCAPLRTAMRTALRADLFSPPDEWNDVQRKAATDLGAACMVPWHTAVASDDAKPLESFTAAFEAHGVALDGKTFLQTLGGLCGARPHGTLIDIVPLRRRVAHSWHQDSGISSMTVLLGLPPRDGYEGGGVFSHHVKLSHALRPSFGDTHGAVVEYERLQDPPPPQIPEDYILRPVYRRGCEVWVSDDASHLHSTPDVQMRECLWRFM